MGTATVTVSPTASASSSQISALNVGNNSKNPQDKNGGFFSSSGKVAGVFTVVGLVIVAIIGGLLWYWYKKRNATMPQSDSGRALSGKSFNSTAASGAVGTPIGMGISRLDPDEKELYKGALYPVIDQRLDPRQIYMQYGDTGSRQSLPDQYDYSRRVFRVTNPGRDSIEER